jgi:protocatechuate 3,4-dioxygenase beta subunit
MADEMTPFNPFRSRRELLKGFAGALAVSGLGLRNTVLAANNGKILTPGLTEGPYWVDVGLLRSDVRLDPATGIVQPGLPVRLSIHVDQVLANGNIIPLRNAFVDIWHCNSVGVYSDIQMEGTLGEKFLRGLQATNALGNVTFTTVYPGWYQGRTVHIHFRIRVFDPTTKALTYNFVSQMFFDDATTSQVYSRFYPYALRPARSTVNATDGIYTGASSDGEVTTLAGEYVMASLGMANGVRTVSLNVLMNLADAGYNNPTGGFTGGGPGGPGGPPPPLA